MLTATVSEPPRPSLAFTLSVYEEAVSWSSSPATLMTAGALADGELAVLTPNRDRVCHRVGRVRVGGGDGSRIGPLRRGLCNE